MKVTLGTITSLTFAYVLIGLEQQAPEDLYPQAHILMQAAEAGSAHVPPVLDDRSRPLEWVARLYARGGYLQESAKAFSHTSATPFALINALAVYGNLDGAKDKIAAIADPALRASALINLAEILRRMGEAPKAEPLVAESHRVARQIKDPAHGTQILALIDQTALYLSDEPASRISPKPSPPQYEDDPQKTSIPLFPITPNGLADHSAHEGDRETNVNSERMTQLFALIRAQDRDGLFRLVDKAETPFEKAFTLVAVEHVAIQVGELASAEDAAKQIPETNDECLLAKAEALSSAAAAWAGKGEADGAGPAFDVALKFAQLARLWPLAQVDVIVAIAEAQATAGLAGGAEQSLQAAQQVALRLPMVHGYPQPRNNRSHAYERILIGAIHCHNLGYARTRAAAWQSADRRAAQKSLKLGSRHIRPTRPLLSLVRSAIPQTALRRS